MYPTIKLHKQTKKARIIELYKKTKKARNTYLCSLKSMKKRYLIMNQQNTVIFKKKTQDNISNLKLLLAYLKKHKELKTIYNSYKELLQLILMYKKKFQYFNHISKPLISKKDMVILLNQQNTMLKDVEKLNELIPDIKTFI